jgi:hypothetical protein
MNEAPKQSEARPILAWLAGLTCTVYLVLAFVSAFPSILDATKKPQPLLAFFFVWAAFGFGIIGSTGKLQGGRATPAKLIAAARKYAAGQMTLEEYGSVTKDIISKG